MRVIVNELPSLGQKTGIGHYTAQLVRCLHQQAGGDVIDGFPQRWGRRVWQACARARAYLEPPSTDRQPGQEPMRWALSSLQRGAVRQLRQCGRALRAQHFRAVCRREGYDLYHEPNFIPLASDRPTLATLHDLSFLLHPEWHPPDRIAHFEKHFERGLARCMHFLAISEFARQEMIDTLNIAPERITRTYMGIRPDLAPLPHADVATMLRQLGLPPRYLLYLGTIEPRKNLLVLLRAYCSLPQDVRTRWPLLLVGSWGWNTAQIAEYFYAEARHRGVIHVGYAPEHTLAAIYNGGRALVYPSLYEGFGMPPMEMMACGGAVLASTAGALVETVGSKSHLIHPEDVEGWRDAMERVVVDDDWWQSLRNGVTEFVRRYSWDRCAADTLAVYRSLCAPAGDPSRETFPASSEASPEGQAHAMAQVRRFRQPVLSEA